MPTDVRRQASEERRLWVAPVTERIDTPMEVTMYVAQRQ
jgi:hypothetical protein